MSISCGMRHVGAPGGGAGDTLEPRRHLASVHRAAAVASRPSRVPGGGGAVMEVTGVRMEEGG